MRLSFSGLLLGVALLLLTACGAEPGPAANVEPSPTATWAPVPTYTPTPEVATAVAEPTATPTQVDPTATPEPTQETVTETSQPEAVATDTPASVAAPVARLVVTADAVNVRLGPGTHYEQIAVAARNAQFDVTGRNETGDWWQICCFDGRRGWLFSALVDVQNPGTVAIAADMPAAPTATATPEAVAVAAPPAPVAESPVPAAAAPPPPPPAASHSGTAGSFDPSAQYHIVHYRVRGFGENNGGIFNQGGQHHIFITVLDQNGNGVDGAVIKDAVGDKVNIVTGSKGPGKAEHAMYWDPYKLYVAADPSGPVTSQISNQMNTAHPHIPDIIGRLGPADIEYAICPTLEDRCSPPFYHAHWSYEITFQKVR
jgi:uncharacterized protein YraI